MQDKYRIDSGKIAWHPRRVADVIEADTWEKAKKVVPIYWEITTAGACSHRCHFCSVDSLEYPDNFIDAYLLIGRMQEAQQMGVRSVMFAGTGEPLLHRQINEIVSGAVDCGLDAAFTTNGVALNRLDTIAKCSWVKLSINAGTQATYAKVHRTKERDWTRVWNNVSDAVKRKGNCALGVQCVVLPDNFHEMATLCTIARNSGVDYVVLKPYSVGTFQAHAPIQTNYAEWDASLSELPAIFNTDKFKVIYRANAMRQEREKHPYDKCRATPFVWVYSRAEGDVFSCSAHLLDQRFHIGNLNNQSFREIWEGEGRRANWEMMQTFDISNCRLNCRQNQNNIFLDQVANGIPHLSFI